jgi:PAS domain S-box-containing protein
MNPNPVLCVAKDGTVVYSNKAGEPLLYEWGIGVGEKLASQIGDFVQRVISRNIPEKMEVKIGNRVYLVEFHPSLGDEFVNVYGFDISDQKKLEGNLRESEEKYRNIVEIANEGIWTLDSEARTTYVNDKMAEMLGYNKEDMIGRPVWDFADEKGKAVLKLKMEKRQRGINDIYEFKLTCKDGSPLWVLISAKSFFNKNGEFTGTLGMFSDVSQQKEAEAKLKETLDNSEKLVKERTVELEKAYNSLKESGKGLSEAQKMAHIGNWEWDIVTDEAYWSDELYRIFERSPQEGAPTYNGYLNYVHPDDRDYVNSALNKAINGKPYSIDHRIVLANGEERTVHIQSEITFDEGSAPVRVKGIVQDITERKKAEEKIRKLADAVESSNDAIITESLDGIVSSWNRGAEQIYDYSAEEILGKNASTLEPDNLKGEIKQLVEKVKQGEKIQHYETLRLKKDGTIINVSLTLSPVFDVSGKLVAISAIARDITEQIKAEELLAKAEDTRKKEIHHRIKNNLQVISSLLDLQAEKFSCRETVPTREILEAFRESQNRVISMSLIHEELYKTNGADTLDFSEYLRKLAENLFRTYSLSSKKICLDLDLEKNAFLNIDTAIPLGIIVNELVSNSLKHAFKGRAEGNIRIKLCREETVEYLSSREESKSEGCESTCFILTVSDDGIGIPESLDLENHDTLGFQLVVSLVDQLDGELELKTNHGTEFNIEFTVTETSKQVEPTN